MFIFNASVYIQAQTTTEFIGAGKYGNFLDTLHGMMIKSHLYKKTIIGKKERQVFVFWMRDHVHVLKALKYWEKDVSSFIEFYLEKQTPSGMFYDYHMPIEWHQNSRMNVFDKKYWEILPEEGVQLHRMPVTADVEYLVVEGVYYVWQSWGYGLCEKMVTGTREGSHVSHDRSSPLVKKIPTNKACLHT